MKRILSALLLALLVSSQTFAAAPPSPPSVSIVGGNASLSVSGVTARVALPVSTSTYPAVTLVNDGTTEVFWQGGNTSVVATTGNYPLQPGRFISVWLGNATNIAAITAGGTSTLRVIQFNGAASMGGAPDGSAISGTVTLGAGSAIVGVVGIDAGTTTGVTGVVTSSSVSSLVIKNAAGNLFSVYATNLTSTAGFLAVVNATSAPVDGAITPLDCVPLPANGAASIAYSAGPPSVYSSGITAIVTSAATCFTKTTGVITAFIRGSAL